MVHPIYCETSIEHLYGQIQVESKIKEWCGVYHVKASRFVFRPKKRWCQSQKIEEISIQFDEVHKRWHVYLDHSYTPVLESPFLFGRWKEDALIITPINHMCKETSSFSLWLTIFFCTFVLLLQFLSQQCPFVF